MATDNAVSEARVCGSWLYAAGKGAYMLGVVMWDYIVYWYEIAMFRCYRRRSVAGHREPQAVANEKKATILILVEI